MSKKILALFGLVTLFSTGALAYGDAGSFEVGPYGGWGFLDSYRTDHPKNSWLAGVRLGYWIDENVSFEPSYQMLFTKTVRAAGVANDDAQIRSFRFNLLYNFMASSRFRPFLTGGLGWENARVDNTFKSNDLGVNAGLGFRYFITENIALRADGRYIYTEVKKLNSDRESNIEATAGLSFFFGGKPKDSDGDGVADKSDKCPNTPAGVAVDAKGCPVDSDGDGVADYQDKCANTPAGVAVDSTGCPPDADADGVADYLDKCPSTPKEATVDENGCPKDSDGDGVADYLDKCPETPKGAKVDAAGCPVIVDSDNDGVMDDKDQCPNTPAGTKVDEKGCPIVSKARGVLKGVTFKFGKAVLAPESFKALDGAAVTLNEFPLVKVEVQGHTDNVGPEAANTKLSQARAQAVSDYLAKKGVAAERLVAKGYGSSRPIAPNTTKGGKAKNRRVELNWLD